MKTYDFNLDGSCGLYGILYCQKVGTVDSWYIRLYASFYLTGKLTLFPGHSLVSNGGMDGSGTHCRKTENSEEATYYESPISLDDIVVAENKEARLLISNYFKTQLKEQRGIKGKYYKLKSFVRRFLFIDCI